MLSVKPVHYEIPMAHAVHGFVMQWASGSFLIFLGDSASSAVDVMATAMKTPYDNGAPGGTSPLGQFGAVNTEFSESEAKRLAHLYYKKCGASVPVFISISSTETDPLFYSAIRQRLTLIVDTLAPPKEVINAAITAPATSQ